MDDIIEELLNSRVNYEFAINPDGTKTTEQTIIEIEKKPTD